MSLRCEFVAMAQQPGVNLSRLCRQFGISRKTGYKWLARPSEQGADRSRRPYRSPLRTTSAIEDRIIEVRKRFDDWGPRKLKRYLLNRGHAGLPAVSTIAAILRRRGLIDAQVSEAAKPWHRFEHPHPNAQWQMDFKGHVAMVQGRCHPLTVLDDHSRFNVVLHACAGESLQDVQQPLVQGFRRYGLPQRISCDNGPPWGTTWRSDRLTQLGVWLIRLGVGLVHARPGHPQTNGKDERFHRTLDSGLLRARVLLNLADAQRAFDEYREIYNLERPHDALGLAVPASRYRSSEREYPESLPPIEYEPTWPVRKVDINGKIHFLGRHFRIAKALRGHPVALLPHPEYDGVHHVYFCHQQVQTIDLRYPDKTTDL